MAAFPNLWTSGKPLVGLGLIMAILAVVILTAYGNMVDLVDSHQKRYREAVATAIAIRDIQAELSWVREDMVVAVLAGGDRAEQLARLEDAEKRTAKVEVALRQVGVALDPALLAVFQELQQLEREFTRTRREVEAPLIEAERVEDAKRIALGIESERAARMRDLSEEIVSTLNRTADEQLAQATAQPHRAVALLLLLGAVGALIGLGVALFTKTLELQVSERSAVAEQRTRQLQELAVELVEAEEHERRRIASLLHNDLQQILAAASMHLRLAQMDLPVEAPRLETVEQLLEESMDKSRRLSHDLSPAILYHSGLPAALRWLGDQMEERYGLEVQVEADEPDYALGDSLKVFLFRSVQELLFNVVKHAGVASARIDLRRSDGSLTVTVSDCGGGFDTSALALRAAGKGGDVRSTGFGLLSIRERIEALGGSLAIESTPGKGSLLALSVALGAPAADVAQPPASTLRGGAYPRLAKPAGGLVGYRVLLVDDHRVMREGLVAMVASQPDIEVVGEAADGRGVIELARELSPDVIIMDVALPGLDGIEATRRIKAEMPEVRVIGLSMYEEELVGEQMRLAGAEAFINKAESSAGLLRAIYGDRLRAGRPEAAAPGGPDYPRSA